MVRRNLQPIRLPASQGQHHVVEVEQVGLVAVDQVERAVEEPVAIRRAQPLAGRMPLRVEVLGVEPIPPLPHAVGLRQHSVIRHAGERAFLVGAL